MQTRREIMRRIALSREAGLPIVNYGILLAAANGIDVASVVPPVLGQSADGDRSL